MTDIAIYSVSQPRTAMRSCRTRKRAFHFYSPGVVRCSHAAVRHVRALCMAAAAAAAADAPDADTASFELFAD